MILVNCRLSFVGCFKKTEKSETINLERKALGRFEIRDQLIDSYIVGIVLGS
jgi:hypothetical protein